MYTMGTSMFGGGGFADSQQEYCECIPKDEVKTHYSQLVHKFYLDHVPDKAGEWADETESGKLSKWLSPYTNGENRQEFSKITKLHVELYSKYDSAIAHVGDRVGMNPPRPKNAKKEEL